MTTDDLRARAREMYIREVPEFGYSHERDAFETGYLAHVAQRPSKDTLTRTIAACDPYTPRPDAMHREMAEAVLALLDGADR